MPLGAPCRPVPRNAPSPVLSQPPNFPTFWADVVILDLYPYLQSTHKVLVGAASLGGPSPVTHRPPFYCNRPISQRFGPPWAAARTAKSDVFPLIENWDFIRDGSPREATPTANFWFFAFAGRRMRYGPPNSIFFAGLCLAKNPFCRTSVPLAARAGRQQEKIPEFRRFQGFFTHVPNWHFEPRFAGLESQLYL